MQTNYIMIISYGLFIINVIFMTEYIRIDKGAWTERSDVLIDSSKQ